VYTGQCLVPQGRATLELTSFGNLLRYNSPDCPVSQRSNDYSAPTVTCYSIKCALERAEVRHARSGAPDTLQYMSGVPPDIQAGPAVRAPTSEPNDLVTWLAHRTLSGVHRTVRCTMRQTASTKRLVWWLGL
jgi:hypothetical protein